MDSVAEVRTVSLLSSGGSLGQGRSAVDDDGVRRGRFSHLEPTRVFVGQCGGKGASSVRPPIGCKHVGGAVGGGGRGGGGGGAFAAAASRALKTPLLTRQLEKAKSFFPDAFHAGKSRRRPAAGGKIYGPPCRLAQADGGGAAPRRERGGGVPRMMGPPRVDATYSTNLASTADAVLEPPPLQGGRSAPPPQHHHQNLHHPSSQQQGGGSPASFSSASSSASLLTAAQQPALLAECLEITGGGVLEGHVRISGAKNSALAVLAGALCCEEPLMLRMVPDLHDIRRMFQVLQSVGAKVTRGMDGSESVVGIDASGLTSSEPCPDTVRKLRASFFVVGSLLARHGEAVVPLPGGCNIGARPIDLHVRGLEALGAREPEVVDLADFLISCGGHIKGAGTNCIVIQGVKRLHSTDFTIIPDRIEAGTFLVAGAICRSEITMSPICVRHLTAVVSKMRSIGCNMRFDRPDSLTILPPYDNLRGTDVTTLPYPGFPTDMQPQLMSLLCLCDGQSVVRETVFESRMRHVEELQKMGAKIKVTGSSAIISGGDYGSSLYGAPVIATDLRAGASLVLAGLAAGGITHIEGVHHIDRGYEKLDEKLRLLGAQIKRLSLIHI
ncbi:hypothetical protein CBR_g40882 [Chara braunii]|uniref:UDP-N-acetylglucosamine 1-carboxyvinyltransferase n=1 Tax=Chara braunii TaxID=69332 RepID=A0A388K298_CHABU|nr:hypothetical protein CBR_g40882 [Chara braunii]|eukprot:GBG64182.1 hypothetical protein CBR_g40882 [Chara braunii]